MSEILLVLRMGVDGGHPRLLVRCACCKREYESTIDKAHARKLRSCAKCIGRLAAERGTNRLRVNLTPGERARLDAFRKRAGVSSLAEAARVLIRESGVVERTPRQKLSVAPIGRHGGER